MPVLINVAGVSKIVVTIVSSVVAITVGLRSNYVRSSFNSIDSSINKLKTAKELEQEQVLFRSGRGHYDCLPSGEAFDLFMDKTALIEQEYHNKLIDVISLINKQKETEKVAK